MATEAVSLEIEKVRSIIENWNRRVKEQQTTIDRPATVPDKNKNFIVTNAINRHRNSFFVWTDPDFNEDVEEHITVHEVEVVTNDEENEKIVISKVKDATYQDGNSLNDKTSQSCDIKNTNRFSIEQYAAFKEFEECYENDYNLCITELIKNDTNVNSNTNENPLEENDNTSYRKKSKELETISNKEDKGNEHTLKHSKENNDLNSNKEKNTKTDNEDVIENSQNIATTRRSTRNISNTSNVKKLKICQHCNREFVTSGRLNQHINTHHNEIKSFICEKCGIAFKTKNCLKDHMSKHSEDRPFICNICGKGFKQKSTLKLHGETHSAKKHICPKCGLQLNSRKTFRLHLVVHNKEFKHKCDICNRGFKRTEGLKHHLIMHTGMKPYKCNFCDSKFTYSSTLSNHKKTFHRNELAAWEASKKPNTVQSNVPSIKALLSHARAVLSARINCKG